MPRKSKTYNHPALVRLLKRGDACESEAAKAVAFAGRHRTLADAVKACRGWNGEYRMTWLGWIGDEDGFMAAIYPTHPGTAERSRAIRTFALGIAQRIDRAVARTRRAAKTRAANRTAAARRLGVAA